MCKIVKIIAVVLCVLFAIGCEKRLIETDYMKNSSYQKIYIDLGEAVNKVSYFPNQEAEKDFYELIEVIKINHNLFTQEELEELYNLMNITYEFKYSGKKYNNNDFKNDLDEIGLYLK